VRLLLLQRWRRIGRHAVQNLTLRQNLAALDRMRHVAAGLYPHVLHAAQNRMRGLVRLEQQPRALFVVGAVVRHPRLAEDLAPEAAFVLIARLPMVLQEFGVRPLDLEGMRRRAEADDGAAALEVVGDVLHLGVGEILEPEEDDQQVSRLERLEPGDVGAAGLDEAGLRVRREEHAALEPVMPRENPRQRGERLLGAVFVIAGQKHDVLPVAGALRSFINHEVRILRNCGRRKNQGSEQGHDRRVSGHSPSFRSGPPARSSTKLHAGAVAHQKVNRIATCMIRGSRAAVALPKFALTCSPAGLNCEVVLMADQLTWLNTLYVSQRN